MQLQAYTYSVRCWCGYILGMTDDCSATRSSGLPLQQAQCSNCNHTPMYRHKTDMREARSLCPVSFVGHTAPPVHNNPIRLSIHVSRPVKSLY